MDLNIHNVKEIKVSAKSLSMSGSGERFHIQKLDITDEEGQQYSVSFFCDSVASLLPLGDREQLDQADSSEDYMGLQDVASIF